MRDFSTTVPSARRSTSMSRGSHATLRKAGFVITAADSHSFCVSRNYCSLRALSSALDIDRLSLLKEGPDAFRKFLGAAAQDLVAVFHRDRSFQRSRVDAHVEAFFRQAQADGRRRNHRVDIGLGSR